MSTQLAPVLSVAMSDWNFGDVWGVIAEVFPDRPAVSQGTAHLTWAEFDNSATNLSKWLLATGIGRQAKVAQYLYNSPAYLESIFACFKASLVPVNTNYRYTDDELAYLWQNSDAEVVIFHASFAERVRESLRGCREYPSGFGSLRMDTTARAGRCRTKP